MPLGARESRCGCRVPVSKRGDKLRGQCSTFSFLSDALRLSTGNENGVGLLAMTKGPPTTASQLDIGSGTVDTAGGPAIFPDPLTVNMMLDSVVSPENAITVGPGVSAGPGVTQENLNGIVLIEDFQVSDAATDGLRVVQGISIGTSTLFIVNTRSRPAAVADG